MIRLASGRTGWLVSVGLGVALLATGCQESTQRQQERTGEVAAEAARKKHHEIVAMRDSASMTPESRNQRISEVYAEADKLLADGINSAPNYWPLKAQRGELLMRKGDHHAARVGQIIEQAGTNVSDASDTLTYLKDCQQATRMQQNRKAAFESVLAKLAEQRKALQEGLDKDGKPIVDSDGKPVPGLTASREQAKSIKAQAEKLRADARAKSEQAAAQKAKSEAIVAEVENLKPSDEQRLAKMAAKQDFDLAEAKLRGEALNLDLQAEILVNLEARKGLDQSVSAPQDGGQPAAGSARISPQVLALRTIPDELAKVELAILSIESRLKELDDAEANCRQQVAEATRLLTGGGAPTTGPDGLAGQIAAQQDRIRTHLGRVSQTGKEFTETVALAENAYLESAKQLKAALVGLRAQISERMQKSTAAGEVAQKSQPEAALELSICSNLAYVHSRLADLRRNVGNVASRLDKARELAGVIGASDLQFETVDSAKQLDAATEDARAAIAVLNDALAVAKLVDQDSQNEMIRDAKLATRVVTKRRESVAESFNLPIESGPRSGGPARPAGPLPVETP